MSTETKLRIAILYPGDYDTRQNATVDNNRFSNLFHALIAAGLEAVPAVYHPDFWQEVYHQLLAFDVVLVWVNPIQDGHDRTVLDSMLRDVANTGLFVSTDPDVILKMGTKEVLYQTRHLGWGTDTYLYNSLDELEAELPKCLASGDGRVLKQYRGNGGSGVWKVELTHHDEAANIGLDTQVTVRHAARGSIDQIMTLAEFFTICEEYFSASGKMIDQAYQARLPEGMIRCYLVHDKVAGFGHQAINALYPTPSGANPSDVLQPGERLYHPPSLAAFQALKQQLEQDWVPALQALLEIPRESLPIIWDADFLLGAKDANGEDTYVLCEINVSSVAPYPESAVSYMVQALIERTRKAST